MKTITLAHLLMASLMAGHACADTIAYDNFEDGNSNGWTLSGDAQLSGVQAIGNYAMRLKQVASAELAVATSGYSGVSLSLNMAATALEASTNDTCYAEYSSDGGSNWTVLLQLVDGQDDGIFHVASLSDASMDDNPDLRIRFRSTGDDLGDYCWGDEVLISGTLGGLTPAPELSVASSLNFGAVAVGSSSTLNLPISNSGTADLHLGALGLSGGEYALSQDNCSNTTLTPSASCQVAVDYTPAGATTSNGQLSIASDDPSSAVTTVSLSGSGYDPVSGGDNFDPLSGNGNVSRTALTLTELLDANNSGSLVDMGAYALPAGAAHPTHHFEGRLVLNDEATKGGFNEITDTFRYTGSQDSTRKHLPEFDYEFVQTGSHLVPVQRGMLANSHPEWEYILEPGRVWDENTDNGYSRAVIPFSLQQKNANCVHNGVMTFAFNDTSITNVAYQIASETCLYFKFDMWGQLGASYTPSSIAGANAIVAAHQAEVAARIPSKPIAQLAIDYPGTDVSAFDSSITASHMTVFGLYIDGTNYVGGCQTRMGTYPYCDVLRVPSYSTAKSNFAGVALMRLEQKYGNAFSQAVSGLIPECQASGNWSDVTLENALDMATGNYALAGYMSDEGATHTNDLFLPEDHASKIDYSCNYYSRKATPGTQWIYHTSDTYIVGTAMNALVKQQQGSTADIFSDILQGELWQPLNVGASSQSTRRTYDSVAQPFSGWGLTYNTDDVVKLARFLSIDNGVINGQPMLDSAELDAALQRNASDRGLVPKSGYYYNNGFWAKDLSADTGCSNLYVPFMSGYGGITVALLPNNSVYYYFSDNDEFLWSSAAVESHNIRSFCGN